VNSCEVEAGIVTGQSMHRHTLDCIIILKSVKFALTKSLLDKQLPYLKCMYLNTYARANTMHDTDSLLSLQGDHYLQKMRRCMLCCCIVLLLAASHAVEMRKLNQLRKGFALDAASARFARSQTSSADTLSDHSLRNALYSQTTKFREPQEVENVVANILSTVKDAVVQIVTTQVNFDWSKPWQSVVGSVASGSGFWIKLKGQGYILTNAHVVEQVGAL
jgi:hypothetical protein